MADLVPLYETSRSDSLAAAESHAKKLAVRTAA
jgi:FMN-dependent NADH-azoreductase